MKKLFLSLVFILATASISAGGGITVYSSSGTHQTGEFIPASDGETTIVSQPKEPSKEQVSPEKQALKDSVNVELEWLESRLKYYENDCHIKGSYRHCSGMTEKFASRIYKIKTNPELYFKEKRIRDRNNKEKRVGRTTTIKQPSIVDPWTGDVIVPVAGGAINTWTGDFYPKVPGGYIDTWEGDFIPAN